MQLLNSKMCLKRIISRGLLLIDLHHERFPIVINLPQPLLETNFLRAIPWLMGSLLFPCVLVSLWQAINSGYFQWRQEKGMCFYFLLRLERFRDHRWVLLSSQGNFIASETWFNYSNVWLKQNPTLGLALIYVSA